VISTIGDADIVLTHSCPIDKKVYDYCPNLKYIGCLSDSYAHIDVINAKKKGIAVTTVRGYATESVAQYTWAMILDAVTGMRETAQIIRSHPVIDKELLDFTYPEFGLLQNMHLGIVGFGEIGRRVSEIASGFGMDISIVTYHPDHSRASNKLEFTDLDNALAKSDIITLHKSLTESSRNLIGEDTIDIIKAGATLINTASAGLIDEAYLEAALINGRIGKAYLDVVDKEPIPENYALLALENCYLTPHIAWASHDSREAIIHKVLRNINSFLIGDMQNRIV
jgi:glycerate dehydrogenase